MFLDIYVLSYLNTYPAVFLQYRKLFGKSEVTVILSIIVTIL